MMMKKALILGAVAALLLGLPALSLGEEVVVEPEESWSEPEETAEILTPAMRLGLEESACEIITLPPIDREALLAEDEAGVSGGEKPLQIGIHRRLPHVSADDWRVTFDACDEYAIRLIIHSPGAVMIRPHFISFPPETKARIYCYGIEMSTIEGPIRKNAAVKTADFWGPPLPGEYYYIECVYKARPTEDELPVIDKISHVYREASDSSPSGGDKAGD